MTSPDPVVLIRDLSFRYPETLSGRSVTALHHLNLTIQPGEFTLITGPSGSGKSTLARCLNGLIPHATNGTMEGSVIVHGMNTREYDTPDFAPHVGMVFQDPGYQLVTADVESEIAFGLEILNYPQQEIRARLDQTTALLQIGHLMGRPISDLSWGERQRVAIASVIAMQPSLLVMDEPFSGIDAASAQNLAELLSDLRKSLSITIIVFEHRTGYLLPMTDRIIVMEAGTILSDKKRDLPIQPCSTWDLPSTLNRSSEGARASVQEIPPQEISTNPSGKVCTPTLSLRDVCYRYPGAKTTVLDGITLDFYPGELTVITGANGSGKTTLLKHCNGLLIPDRGSVFLGAEPLRKKTVAGAAHAVGLLNQHADHQLFESTITDELAFGPRNLGMADEEIGKIILKIRDQCSLSHIDPSTPPLGLSGGEKQRVALAGILTMDTPVIILDEPTFGLDQDLKSAFTVFLRGLCDIKKTVIVATHDEEFGAACGDRFIRISAGHIDTDERKSRGSRVVNLAGGESSGDS
ncbi:ABC transporter ATP-binding protein [uncultured Methanoregula sp.]|uniref:ABC transporter ATP-binding protein n=1 Tax=uncultured Methanoregula sp. TaxID=1005933 RepID=UPI002AAAD7BF|nr:ABC transporter ATP-binding protein [uncultured Methanoregula sp.]